VKRDSLFESYGIVDIYLGISQLASMAESESVKQDAEDERVKNRKRFELELEFVQALANPFYLHSLAQQGILYQPTFINYLKYLQYWKEKDYARFIL
jgi:mediator of RNA polymerase II transcription subunit 31